MSNEINPMAFFQEPSVADLRLLACPGAEELTELIDQHLVEWAKSAGVEKDSFIIPCECPRFQSGDAKGLVRSLSAATISLSLSIRAITALPTTCSVMRTTSPRMTTLPTSSA